MGQVDIMATCNSMDDQQIFHGMGLATDIIRSAARALVHVANDIRCSQQVAKLRNQASQLANKP